MENIKVIAFDADDTLWVNEPYFRASEEAFCHLMENYLPHHDVARALFKTEINNLDVLGYGVKAFIISMVETAMEVSNHTISSTDIEKIISIGKDQLKIPIELIQDIEYVLQTLQNKYKLVMATKGDLKEQEGKLLRSGLASYFHHIEIVSEKTPVEYQKLIHHLDILPQEFLMIGNSVKSDMLPVLEIEGHAWHIPFHTTWEHEVVEAKVEHPNFKSFEKVFDILPYL